MTQELKNMIAGLPFEAATKEIGVIITGLQCINQMAETDAVQEALVEALMAEVHLTQAQKSIHGEHPDEPTLSEMFMDILESLNELSVDVRNQCSNTDDESMQEELYKANDLVNDAIEVLTRAKLRAEGRFKDCKTTRVILQTIGEYFTADHTTPELRFTGIPEEYRK